MSALAETHSVIDFSLALSFSMIDANAGVVHGRDDVDPASVDQAPSQPRGTFALST